jgi:transposase
MAVEITRKDMTAAQLRTASAKTGDARAARRMLAIALVLEGMDRKRAALTCGMDRQTLRDWVHRYNTEGLSGLSNRKAPGRQPRLSAEQRQELATLVENGPDPETDGVVRWRRIDLQRKIEAMFGVAMHERTVSKQLAQLGFVRLSVRPQHPKADEAAQEAFKKTSPTR